VQNGQASKATDGVSGARPSESNFTDGIPIIHAKDTLTFNSASTNGTIIVTLRMEPKYRWLLKPVGRPTPWPLRSKAPYPLDGAYLPSLAVQ